MTIRKHKVKDDGEVEVVEEPINNPWLRILLSTHSWRLIIILFIATMHPLGRSFLKGFGFDWQDTKKIDVAAEEAKSSKKELETIAESIKSIEKDLTSLKANNAILNSKVDTLDQTFRGFQIDFNKWKPSEPKP